VNRQTPADGDLLTDAEQHRRTVTEHVPTDDDPRQCTACGSYWPCWPLAEARDALNPTSVPRYRSNNSGRYGRDVLLIARAIEAVGQ